MDKKSLRKEINLVLAGCTAEQIRLWSDGITRLIIDNASYKSADVVMMFLSMPGEFDTHLLIERAIADGKTVVVPRVNFADKSMVAVKLNSPEQEMVTDRYGLRNPADNIEIDISKIALIIVPGLAFDKQGRRLGRGGGFYDRFLVRPELDRIVRCGVCFEVQLLDEIPTNEQDVVMDMVVTERGIERSAGQY